MTEITLKITNPNGPNATLLLPGACNATCAFCFWDRREAKIKIDPEEYAAKAIAHLRSLPKVFRLLSISGGETSLSPALLPTLKALGAYRRESQRLQRVVLTAHGGGFLRGSSKRERPEVDQLVVSRVAEVVDHVNFSRHEVGYEANTKIFRTRRIPDDLELKALIAAFRELEVTCTLNCVVDEEVKPKFCEKFISYAKDLKAHAVSFRRVAGNVAPTNAENVLTKKYGEVASSNCSVCRGKILKPVRGVEVRFKGSMPEPSVTTRGIYEVIIHPDGGLYLDWGMKHQVRFAEVAAKDEAFYASPMMRPETPRGWDSPMKLDQVPDVAIDEMNEMNIEELKKIKRYLEKQARAKEKVQRRGSPFGDIFSSLLSKQIETRVGCGGRSGC